MTRDHTPSLTLAAAMATPRPWSAAAWREAEGLYDYDREKTAEVAETAEKKYCCSARSLRSLRALRFFLTR